MATIVDVAKLAGVSIKTVSRVINNEAGVRDGTREKVQRAVAQLGYQPHQGARMMRSNRSGIIGLITRAISQAANDPLQAGLSAIHLIHGIQDACREQGRILMMADTGGDLESIPDLLASFHSHQVDGVIYAAEYHQQVLFPRMSELPTVLVNCFDALGTPAVLPDDYGGQFLATQHLLEQGHKCLGYIGLAVDLEAGRQRRDGFFAACRQWDIEESHIHFAAMKDFLNGLDFNYLAGLLQSMLEQAQPPTAIAFGNDLLAMRGIEALKALSIKVPGDLSVIGYDNDRLLIRHFGHELTTVTLPYREMGRMAVQQLLDNQQSNATVEKCIVPSELVLRQTVAAL